MWHEIPLSLRLIDTKDVEMEQHLLKLLVSMQKDRTMKVDDSMETRQLLRQNPSPYHHPALPGMSLVHIQYIYGVLCEVGKKRDCIRRAIAVMERVTAPAQTLRSLSNGIAIHEWNKCMYMLAYESGRPPCAMLWMDYGAFHPARHASAAARVSYKSFDEVCTVCDVIRETLLDHSQMTICHPQSPLLQQKTSKVLQGSNTTLPMNSSKVASDGVSSSESVQSQLPT